MINTRYSHPFSQDVDELIWDNKNIKRRNNQKAVLSATMTLNTYIYTDIWVECTALCPDYILPRPESYYIPITSPIHPQSTLTIA